MKYRSEWKYIYKNTDAAGLFVRLNTILEQDPHYEMRTYTVRSLYFDDFHNSCWHDNEAGVPERYKWRIRYYVAPGAKKFLHLEKKVKKYELGYKLDCPITQKVCRELMAGNVDELLWQTKEPLVREFCAEILAKGFHPTAIIEYERTAYIEPLLDVRVTVDENISAGYEFSEFLSGKYMRMPVQGEGLHILEVKFSDLLPGYIHDIISTSGMQKTAFSKYYYGRRALNGYPEQHF